MFSNRKIRGWEIHGSMEKKNTETEINSKKNIEVCKLVARHLYSRFWRYEHTFINVTKRKVKLGEKNFFVSEWVGGGGFTRQNAFILIQIKKISFISLTLSH